MDFRNLGQGFNDWIIKLFIAAIQSISTEEDREAILRWLALAREVVSHDSLSSVEKIKALYNAISSKELFKIAFNSLVQAVKSYKDADLPLPVKVSIPVALGALAVLGGQGAGIAGMGGAIGLPIILVIFVGAAGITSIIEAFVGKSGARSYITFIAAMIARDEILRRTRKDMQEAMGSGITEPRRVDVPEEHQALREALMKMDPFEFERHVMSFFQKVGLVSWVTKKSNDFGADGFARHQSGLIVVQCKRNATDNLVGRPTVQQFKGVIEENEAWRGYIVTTSRFTQEARESAEKNEKIVLIEIDELLWWHQDGLKF